MNRKTLTTAEKNGISKIITRHKSGWNLPPEDGRGAYIDGTGAYRECVARWQELGWSVKRQKNPHYRPRHMFSFA